MEALVMFLRRFRYEKQIIRAKISPGLERLTVQILDETPITNVPTQTHQHKRVNTNAPTQNKNTPTKVSAGAFSFQ
ncbi:MAG: hypothetical protein HQL54_12145 [Magnetococcales bacterium]|nr:hypothetical protein [Magnetococcales bacterium]